MKRMLGLSKGALAFLIVCVILFSFCACQGTLPAPSVPNDDPAPMESPENDLSTDLPQSAPPTNPSPSDPTRFLPTEEFVIIYPRVSASIPAMQEAIDYLNTAMQSAYGFTLSSEDDSYDLSVGLTPHQHEILLGATTRRHSQNALDGFASEDSMYWIKSRNAIVIGGGSISSTLEAVKQFCADVIGYRGDGSTIDGQPQWKIGTTYTNRAYELVTINGAPLSEWTIGIDESSPEAKLFANQLVEYFSYYTNEKIPIVNSNTLTGEETNMIAIGAIGRNLEMAYFKGEYYLSKTDNKGSVISIRASDALDLPTLSDILWSQMTRSTKGKHVAFTIPKYEYIHFDVEDEISVWTLKEETRTEIFKGVTHIEQLFYDEENKPYRTNALVIDPAYASLRMGSSNDGYERVPSSRQTPLQHMKAAVAKGRKVIAAVNANYFNIDGDYSPNGLALKDGVLINASRGDLPFFAITDEGEIVIDEGHTYNSYVEGGKNFVQGVAAGPILLQDGLLTYEARQAKDEALAPRTLIGVTSDGKIILGVIDGRQPKYSNGSTHLRSALWMRSLGAINAMNLDGGGSSSFILRDPRTNTYDVCNSPSDSSGMRKVYNSLLVELK